MMWFVVWVFSRVKVDSISGVGGKLRIDVVMRLLMLGGVPPIIGFLLKLGGLFVFYALDLMMVFYLVFISVVMCYVYVRIGYGVYVGGAGSKGRIVYCLDSGG